MKPYREETKQKVTKRRIGSNPLRNKARGQFSSLEEYSQKTFQIARNTNIDVLTIKANLGKRKTTLIEKMLFVSLPINEVNEFEKLARKELNNVTVRKILNYRILNGPNKRKLEIEFSSTLENGEPIKITKTVSLPESPCIKNPNVIQHKSGKNVIGDGTGPRHGRRKAKYGDGTGTRHGRKKR